VPQALFIGHQERNEDESLNPPVTVVCLKHRSDLQEYCDLSEWSNQGISQKLAATDTG